MTTGGERIFAFSQGFFAQIQVEVINHFRYRARRIVFPDIRNTPSLGDPGRVFFTVSVPVFDFGREIFISPQNKTNKNAAILMGKNSFLVSNYK